MEDGTGELVLDMTGCEPWNAGLAVPEVVDADREYGGRFWQWCQHTVIVAHIIFPKRVKQHLLGTY